jgi:hypothetical protein
MLFLIQFGGNSRKRFTTDRLTKKKIGSKWNINKLSTFQDGVLSFGVDGLSQQTFERNFKRCSF